MKIISLYAEGHIDSVDLSWYWEYTEYWIKRRDIMKRYWIKTSESLNRYWIKKQNIVNIQEYMTQLLSYRTEDPRRKSEKQCTSASAKHYKQAVFMGTFPHLNSRLILDFCSHSSYLPILGPEQPTRLPAFVCLLVGLRLESSSTVVLPYRFCGLFSPSRNDNNLSGVAAIITST